MVGLALVVGAGGAREAAAELVDADPGARPLDCMLLGHQGRGCVQDEWREPRLDQVLGLKRKPLLRKVEAAFDLRYRACRRIKPPAFEARMSRSACKARMWARVSSSQSGPTESPSSPA